MKKPTILVIVIAIIAGGIGFYLYTQMASTYTKLTITPAELSPFVSHEEARNNVCSKMKGHLFDETCQEKFDNVSKSDDKKIGELFSLLKKIENDSSTSDYERLLLAQTVFTALPTKDSPLTQSSGNNITSNLLKFFSQKNVAHAQSLNNNSETNLEDFKKIMAKDLEKVVGDLPKGDNAWVICVNVSKYQWINGVRQPIYSESYLESRDPYPGVSIEDKSGWEQRDTAHVRSRVSSYSTSDIMLNGAPKEGMGEMIAYSFSIMSWKSKPYGADSKIVLSEVGPSEKYLPLRKHHTEDGYKGDDLISNLLSAVKMPSREQATQVDDKDIDIDIPPPGTPIRSSDSKLIGGTPGCEGWIHDPQSGIYCFDSFEQIEELVRANSETGNKFKIGVLDLVESMEPTYPYTDIAEMNQKWDECIKLHPSDTAQCDPMFN